MDEIKLEGEQLVIGANVTYRALARSPLIRDKALCLAQMARVVGARQIQNMARLPGNIANASKAGDAIPVLMSLNGLARILDSRGEISLVPIQELIKEMRKTSLKPDEAIIEIVIPKLPDCARTGFGKIGHGGRNELTIANATLAMVISCNREENRIEEASIVIGAVAPVAYHDRDAERLLCHREPTAQLQEELAELLQKNVEAILQGKRASLHKANDIKALGFDVFGNIFWDVL